jgi:hypothetical protein
MKRAIMSVGPFFGMDTMIVTGLSFSDVAIFAKDGAAGNAAAARVAAAVNVN